MDGSINRVKVTFANSPWKLDEFHVVDLSQESSSALIEMTDKP